MEIDISSIIIDFKKLPLDTMESCVRLLNKYRTAENDHDRQYWRREVNDIIPLDEFLRINSSNLNIVIKKSGNRSIKIKDSKKYQEVYKGIPNVVIRISDECEKIIMKTKLNGKKH
jgi:hypothetical protein